uniref:C-factor-like n=1 Tax=Varanus komodoensis TaxID=61221 RepID=A0A8D2J4S6_VARKO
MAMLNLQSVLVTGANRGIGLELVKQLVGKSHQIFATCRDPEGPRAKLGILAHTNHKHKNFLFVAVDASEPSSIRAAAAKVTERLKGAGLNLLINNAGIVKPGDLESTTPEVMSELYNTNVIGPLMVSQVFLPLLRKAAQGSPQKGMSCSKAAIINMSSEGGSITNLLLWESAPVIAYRCSKAALNMLTRCQGLGLAEDKILCIALHPGWVQTDMGNSVGSAPQTVQSCVQDILNTLSRLSEKDSGMFMNWEGKAIPW